MIMYTKHCYESLFLSHRLYSLHPSYRRDGGGVKELYKKYTTRRKAGFFIDYMGNMEVLPRKPVQTPGGRDELGAPRFQVGDKLHPLRCSGVGDRTKPIAIGSAMDGFGFIFSAPSRNLTRNPFVNRVVCELPHSPGINSDPPRNNRGMKAGKKRPEPTTVPPGQRPPETKIIKIKQGPFEVTTEKVKGVCSECGKPLGPINDGTCGNHSKRKK